MVNFNQEIFDKAKEIIDKQYAVKNYEEICLDANICPKCGCDIVTLWPCIDTRVKQCKICEYHIEEYV